VLDGMNGAFTTASGLAGWTVLGGHVNGAINGNSMCAQPANAFFNALPLALKTQGNDLPGGGGVFKLSAGVVHPTVAGHRNMYGPVIEAALKPLLTTRFTPAAPTRLRITRQVTNGAISVAWDDRSDVETSYHLTIERIDGTGSPTVRQTFVVPENTQSFTLGTIGTGVWKASLKAVVDAGTNDLESASISINVSNRKPTARALPPTSILLQNTSAPIRVGMPAQPDLAHMFFTLEIEQFNGTRTSQAVTTSTTQVSGGKRARVASCNLLGCGLPSDFVDLPQQQVIFEICTAGSIRGPGGTCVPDTRPTIDPNLRP